MRRPRLPRVTLPFDGEDLRLAAQGIVLAVVLTIGVLWLAGAVGLAVRVFEITAGMR